jgi:hypothetical protein
VQVAARGCGVVAATAQGCTRFDHRRAVFLAGIRFAQKLTSWDDFEIMN